MHYSVMLRWSRYGTGEYAHNATRLDKPHI